MNKRGVRWDGIKLHGKAEANSRIAEFIPSEIASADIYRLRNDKRGTTLAITLRVSLIPLSLTGFHNGIPVFSIEYRKVSLTGTVFLPPVARLVF